MIVRAAGGMSASGIAPIIQQLGATLGRRLPNIGSHVAVVPNALLRRLAASPFVDRVSLDRDVVGTMERTSATIGATIVRQEFGYDGSGVGVAIIDSGVTAWHDDLADAAGAMRVDRFVDFVGGGATAYDDYGHGTHVAGIIAGNGFDSGGARAGIAPAAHLIVLKALDGTGRGHISDVIAALDYAVAQRQALNIRVINLSVAAGVLRVVQRRSADAGRAKRRAGRHRRCRRRREHRPERRRPYAVRRHHRPRERAMGVDGRRLEPHGNRGPLRRYGCDVHVSRTDGRGFSRQTGHRCAGRRHRVARGSRQRSVHLRGRVPAERDRPDRISSVLSLSGTSAAAPVVTGTSR